jgi:hypothetical protein
MIVLSLYLSKGPEIDQYFYHCGRRESVPRYPWITHTRGLRSGLRSGLRGGLRKRLYALPGGSAGSGHLQLILG